MRTVDLPWDDPKWREEFERRVRLDNAQLFAKWNAERAKGKGSRAFTDSDITSYDTISRNTVYKRDFT